MTNSLRAAAVVGAVGLGLFAAVTFGFAACTSDADQASAPSTPPDAARTTDAPPGPDAPSAPDALATLAAAVDALGGSAALAAAKAQTWTASGSQYDQLESYSPVPGEKDETTLQMTYTSAGAVSFEGPGHSLTWDGKTVEVLPGREPKFTQASRGKFGFTTGTETGYPPLDPSFMTSIEVAARWKQQAMRTPGVLLAWALANPSSVRADADETWNGSPSHVLRLVTPWGWPADVRLFVDAATKLPVKSETMEDDPVRGDTKVEITFTDWRPAGALKAPFALTHTLNGSKIETETRSAVTTETASGHRFDVPAMFQAGYDAAGAAWGTRSAQFFLRYQAFAYPLYFDQSVGVPPYVPGLVKDEVVATAGAKVVHYRFSFYNTMVVEMPTYLVVVEAPLYDSASAAAIADIKARFGAKPVKAVVSTHFHFDHTGGIRRYLAEWPNADLYVPAEVVDFYAALVKAPHTLATDTSWKTPWLGAIKPVAAPAAGAKNGAPTVLGDTGTSRTVKLFDMVVDHSKGHVVATLEDAHVVFTTDLDTPTGTDAGGPMPDGKEMSQHDVYARQLIANLAAASPSYTPVATPDMKFVCGHGAVGGWGELCVYGYGWGASGKPAPGTPIDPSKVCP